jgi:carbon storage regulator
VNVVPGRKPTIPFKEVRAMLVLTRKLGQRVIIGNEIEVIVLEVHGSRVKLGVQVPSEVPIHRSEVFDRIADETAPPVGAQCG